MSIKFIYYSVTFMEKGMQMEIVYQRDILKKLDLLEIFKDVIPIITLIMKFGNIILQREKQPEFKCQPAHQHQLQEKPSPLEEVMA